MSRFSTISDVWEYLNAVPMFQKSGNEAIHYSLDNIRHFCSELGNPHLQYPVVHVAGTNGKGTTCYMLENIYRDAGFKTGMFTSPHLLRYNERVRVSGVEIPDDYILEFFQNADELLNKIKLSYFEISTALAFWYFAKQEIEIAFVEAGLGGRLDSTNIVESEVSVITSIGLDHQNILGNTEQEIAFEKAGIIKRGKPLVIGNVQGEALKELKKQAHQKISTVSLTENLEPQWNDGKISFANENFEIQTSLKESVNKWNVACAWKVWKILKTGFPVSEQQFRQSLETFSGAPGRFEKLHRNYEWYFSGSHNIQALDASLEAVKTLKKPEEAVLVFSAMKDKINEQWINRLKNFKKQYFVEQEGARAATLKEVENYIRVSEMNEDNAQFILNELKTELVIFAGSFYFYPIVRRWISKVE